LETAFRNDEVLYGTLIAIDDSMTGFVYVDSSMSDQVRNFIKPEEKPAYYKAVREDLPQTFLRAARMLWNIRELKEIDQRKGGYGTTLAKLQGDFNHIGDTVSFVIKKLYWQRMSSTLPFYQVTIDLKTHEIWVMDMRLWPDGREETLDTWRKGRKTTKQLEVNPH
jgi:hypothetical protein